MERAVKHATTDVRSIGTDRCIERVLLDCIGLVWDPACYGYGRVRINESVGARRNALHVFTRIGDLDIPARWTPSANISKPGIEGFATGE